VLKLDEYADEEIAVTANDDGRYSVKLQPIKHSSKKSRSRPKSGRLPQKERSKPNALDPFQQKSSPAGTGALNPFEK
jgi:hypothetical protein